MRFVPNIVTQKAALTVLRVQKNSPTILFASGIVGVVATAVLASRATLRLNEVLEEAADQNAQVDSAAFQHPDKYSAQDQVKDKTIIRVRTALGIVKLYAPAIIVGGLSIAALTGSHRILSKRNAGLAAAYAAVDKAFREYRERVATALGEEKEREFYYGVEKVKVTEVDENGKKTQVEKKVATAKTIYGRLFNERNANHTPRPDINLVFIRGVQNGFNQQLEAHGFVILNDVYKALGMEPSTAGALVGWVYDHKRHGGSGDGYIDFGIWDGDDNMSVRDYMLTGDDGEIFLDFNVDGEIYQLIDQI